MNLFANLFLLLCLITLGTACNSSKNIFITDISKDYIILEKGGGISGLSTQYIITEDAEVYKKVFSDTLIYADVKLDKRFIDNTFNSIEKLSDSPSKKGSPRNMYKKLIFHNHKAGTETTWIWDPSEKSNILNTHFNNLTKSVEDEH